MRTTLCDRVRAERDEFRTLGIEYSELRRVRVIDMTPVLALPRPATPDQSKIEAYSQCKPDRLPLWFEGTIHAIRTAGVVVDPAAIDLNGWTEFGGTNAQTQRRTTGASYGVTVLTEREDRIVGIATLCLIYLDVDFNVSEVVFFNRLADTDPSALFDEAHPGLADAWRAADLLPEAERDAELESLGVRGDEMEAVEERLVEHMTAQLIIQADAIVPTLQALSLLSHGIAILEDRPVSRNKHVRRHSADRTPVRTMRLYAPPGQTDMERHQRLHWRAERWAHEDRGAGGRFVTKGTGEDELIFYPGRWVGDPAIGNG
jgi:hypothetical protein